VPSPPLGPEALGEQLHVSRETLERLTVYLELLRRWQRAVNLVGRGTLADPWRRHVLDCAQLAPHVPAGAATVVDLGSGAGFPGMVLSIMGVRGIHLVESDRRKAQFLRAVARATGASVQVHAERIERMRGWPADVVTARALAPLPRLLVLAERFMTSDSVCLFLKGRSGARELTEARVTWHMEAEMFPSRSEPTGMVLQLRGIRRARHRQS
jgi:16S rRNA (guanine527-N7)-methyltransferase